MRRRHGCRPGDDRRPTAAEFAIPDQRVEVDGTRRRARVESPPRRRLSDKATNQFLLFESIAPAGK
jgi:hypothetical protein